MGSLPPRVLFVLPRMVTGGVERVTLQLIEAFVAQGVACRLALRRPYGELLPAARALVDVDDLASDGLHRFVPQLARLMRSWQPTHVITAFSDVGLLSLLAMRLAGSPARLLHGVHNVHLAVGAQRGVRGWLQHRIGNLLAGPLYRRADRVIAVSQGLRDDILRRYALPEAQVVAIHNPVAPLAAMAACATQTAGPGPARIVSIGRLETQKGFDVLLRAVAGLHEAVRLEIWGEGRERARLQALIEQLGLQGRAVLRGHAAQPLDVLRGATVFVMASRWEGFGNTLVEAMSQGAQVVASDCPYGPREILEDGRWGQLVPVEDVQALRKALERSLDGVFRVDPDLLVQRARAFSREAAATQWLDLVTD